uniref:Uncharacterized protein n=1 Tax=Arcella intermedia TaxID=1963864 RepID=A0A6B2LTH5_9EUKA
MRSPEINSFLIPTINLEINPTHPIILKLKKLESCKDRTVNIKDFIWLLFEISLCTSGFSLHNPATFAQRVYKLIKLELGIEIDEESQSDTDEELPYEINEMEWVD